MTTSVPPELKKVTPFVKRAEELDRDKANPESRLVAYYCRQYAVHTGIPLAKSPAAKQCLGNILGELEKEKAAMSNFTRDESKYLCRKFADAIFDKADGEDRLGMATKNTAKTFYAAASFYEILEQFYEEGEDSEEYQEEKKRCKFAKWKATEILKAIREGREPTPGGYGEALEEEEEDIVVSPQEPTNETPSDVSALTMPPMPPPAVETVEQDDDDSTEEKDDKEEEDYNEEGTEVGLAGLGPPPPYPGESLPDQVFVDGNHPEPTIDRPPIVPPPVYKPPVAKPPTPEKKKSSSFLRIGKKKATTSESGKVSKAALADAVELTSFALAALQSKDAELGATRLKQALEALGR
jgi:vacuolar protein sorting-associated protein VTA1